MTQMHDIIDFRPLQMGTNICFFDILLTFYNDNNNGIPIYLKTSDTFNRYNFSLYFSDNDEKIQGFYNFKFCKVKCIIRKSFE